MIRLVPRLALALLLVPALARAADKPAAQAQQQTKQQQPTQQQQQTQQQAAACVLPPVGKQIPFALGERLEFEIDSLGATVGTFSMTVLPGKGGEPYVLQARGKTGTFAANFYAVDAVAETRMSKTLEGRHYQEDATEAGVHRTTDVDFPAVERRLPVRATREGNREDFTLQAPPETRDMLSGLYAVRSMQLADGSEVCVPIFGARRVWTLRAKVVGREPVRTPAGDFQTIHVQGTAVRLDNPQISREVHLWFSDDALRLPVAAFGLIQNKPVRAQLTGYDPGRRKVAQAPRR